MSDSVRESVEAAGGKYKGEAPGAGGGAFGMALLAHALGERLAPSRGLRPGRPTDASWTGRGKLPLTPETEASLADIAATLSREGPHQVSPMQVAAVLLELAVAEVLATMPRKPE